MQNIYTLPDLIDFALIVPEVGVVNFNILHTVLHSIVNELELTEVRPWCRIENPFLTKEALIKARLKKPLQEKVASKKRVPEKDDERATAKEKELSSKTPSVDASVEDVHLIAEIKPSATQTEKIESKDTEVTLTETQTLLESRDTAIETEKTKAEDSIADTSEKSTTPAEKKLDDGIPLSPKTPTEQGTQHATQHALEYTNLRMRVDATEEGLNRLSNSVDIIADKMRKAEKRKEEGGPSSAELESIDERLLEVEDALDQFAADHKLLADMIERFTALLKEFEAIKALSALLEQMQIDISKKADKEETIAALALKGDLELVNTKVDQQEFETAIKELGEAIGLLGLKFTRKNDEWEERVAEIWKAIDSKMTFDLFEAARIKTQSRLTALMCGLRKLKNVVEDLLYPEASGVTRCILCRRPACISGLECMEGIETDSLERPLSASSAGDAGNSQKLKNILDNDKEQKLDVPPFWKSQEIIISVPDGSSSYRRVSAITGRHFRSPKLQDIAVRGSKIDNIDISVEKPKAKHHTQKPDLFFTKKLLEKVKLTERESSPETQKYKPAAVLEVGPSVKDETSSRSSAPKVNLMPDLEKFLNESAR